MDSREKNNLPVSDLHQSNDTIPLSMFECLRVDEFVRLIQVLARSRLLVFCSSNRIGMYRLQRVASRSCV
ncbi:hypothetical protein CsSME_00000005 [Camellia sinensis var. sinensis]